jgi:hypothetical protein
MEWALASVALALLAVAAVSRLLSGSPVTPAMVLVACGLLVGPEVLRGLDLGSTSSTVRTLAEGPWRSSSSPMPLASIFVSCAAASACRGACWA